MSLKKCWSMGNGHFSLIYKNLISGASDGGQDKRQEK